LARLGRLPRTPPRKELHLDSNQKVARAGVRSVAAQRSLFEREKAN